MEPQLFSKIKKGHWNPWIFEVFFQFQINVSHLQNKSRQSEPNQHEKPTLNALIYHISLCVSSPPASIIIYFSSKHIVHATKSKQFYYANDEDLPFPPPFQYPCPCTPPSFPQSFTFAV